MLGVAGAKCGGSKSDSTSEGGAGGRSWWAAGFAPELFGARDSKARRRAAGVSAVGECEEAGIDVVKGILGVDCASRSPSSKLSEPVSVVMCDTRDGPAD